MRRIFTIMIFSILPFPHSIGANDDPATEIDRIEEDWKLVISTPDTNLTCPQVQTLMRLDSHRNSAFLAFNLNYRELPSFYAGGLQVKIQDGDDTLATDSQGSEQLSTSNETIAWTQRLTLTDGVLRFKVSSGTSTTWGVFGQGDDDLAVSLSTERSSLSDYSPTASARDSGPGFGSNRVTSMALLRVRYYHGDTLISTDSTEREVVNYN